MHSQWTGQDRLDWGTAKSVAFQELQVSTLWGTHLKGARDNQDITASLSLTCRNSYTENGIGCSTNLTQPTSWSQ